MQSVLATILYSIIEYYQSITLIAIISLLLHWLFGKKNLPPGPWGIPIFGYMPFLKGSQHLALTHLNERYGNIISVYLGNVLVVVLGDYKAIKEAFVKQGFLFSGKPQNNPLKIGKIDSGLSVLEGEMAIQHRRFFITSLKNFGMGKLSLEQSIMVEIKSFLNELRNTKSQPINLKSLTSLSAAKIIAMFEFGNSLNDTNELTYEMSELVFQISYEIGAVGLRTFFPWTSCIPFVEKITGLKQLKERINRAFNIIHKMILKKKENYNENSNADYIDSYITEKKRLLEKNGSEGCFSEHELLGNALGLFGAGIDTSVTYLLWTIIYMLKYPNVKDKVQREIDEVIGKGRDPVMADKNFMPYTEATMLEVHRLCSIVPFSLVHSNMEETELSGYHIPKRSYVIANLWAVHHDPSLWNDPYEFKPERFIDQNDKIQKPDYLIPFSIGKRNCIGEILANTTSFLYFVSLFQNFEIQLPKGNTISTESTFGILLQPKPFNVCCHSY